MFLCFYEIAPFFPQIVTNFPFKAGAYFQMIIHKILEVQKLFEGGKKNLLMRAKCWGCQCIWSKKCSFHRNIVRAKHTSAEMASWEMMSISACQLSTLVQLKATGLQATACRAPCLVRPHRRPWVSARGWLPCPWAIASTSCVFWSRHEQYWSQ